MEWYGMEDDFIIIRFKGVGDDFYILNVLGKFKFW